MGYTKEDVRLGPHMRDGMAPTVNVKVYTDWRRTDMADVIDVMPEDSGSFTVEWVESHVSDDAFEQWFGFACESEVEYLSEWADEIFGRPCKLEQAGRSGGWLYLPGLPELDEWDAVMLAKWRKFERLARQVADGIWIQVLSLIYCNVFESWREARDAEAADDAAATLPILANV